MELHQIRYFLALCDTLNFTKAAELCHVSQPALTRAIGKMEDELGGLLFSRERNKTHLTELGRLIQPNMAEVVAQAGAARHTAAQFLKLENASLALGVMCTMAPVQFVSFLSRFKMDHPGVQVTLQETVPGLLCERLLSGDLDVALMARPTGFPDPLRAVSLYTERFVIACSAGHRFAARKEVALSELDGEAYLMRINCEYAEFLGELCTNHGVRLMRSYRSEREDWILTMVAAGLGVCLLPEFTATFPGVVGCLVSSPVVHREVCLVSVAGRRQSSPVKAFVRAVRGYDWPQRDGRPSAAGHGGAKRDALSAAS